MQPNMPGAEPVDSKELKKQIGKLTLFQFLSASVVLPVLLLDLAGKIPDPPGSAVIAGGSIGLVVLMIRFLQEKKKKLSAELVAAAPPLPIAEP